MVMDIWEIYLGNALGLDIRLQDGFLVLARLSMYLSCLKVYMLLLLFWKGLGGFGFLALSLLSQMYDAF